MKCKYILSSQIKHNLSTLVTQNNKKSVAASPINSYSQLYFTKVGRKVYSIYNNILQKLDFKISFEVA